MLKRSGFRFLVRLTTLGRLPEIKTGGTEAGVSSFRSEPAEECGNMLLVRGRPSAAVDV